MKKQVISSLSKDKHTSHEQQQRQILNHYSTNNPQKTIPYERRCHTPSILGQQHKKSKSKPAKESKEKLSEKKAVYYSIKNFKPQGTSDQQYHSNMPMSSQNKESKPSPFKHKHTKNKSTYVGNINFVSHGIINHPTKSKQTVSKPLASGIGNARQARNLESQLSHLANLSDSSIFKSSQNRLQRDRQISMLIGGNDSAKKSGNNKNKKHTTSQLHETLSTKEHPLMTQGINNINNIGKSMMKVHNFPEAIRIFEQLLNHIPSTYHAQHIQTQCHYLIGVCHFHLNAYESVVQELTQVIVLDQQYRKNVYLFLGIAYKKLNMIEEALLVLGKALTLYPKYMDVLLLRAKILSKQKRFYDSIEDLNKCIKLQPTNIQAYVSKADCLRNLSQFKEAINIYTEVLIKDKMNLEILLKRAITFIQNDQINDSLTDLSKILSLQPKNSQAYLFKGLAYTKQKNYNESILSYEQAIKFNTSNKATTKALYEIAKLKIQIGDYYGASYTLQRGQSLDIDLKIIQKLKTFVDGATFIMKKKYRRGIELLGILGKKEHLNEMIRSLLYSFRAYGHFCLNKYVSALSDLRQLIKSGFVLDSASEYNMALLEGIIKCQNNEFAQSMQKFKKAGQMRKQFGDPQMFQALCKIAEYNRTPKLRQKNTHLLTDALHFIKLAIQKQQNFNYYYLCALVLYILKDYHKALIHLEQAIQGSDVHILKHFYLRAMINAMQEKYQECFTDLNNVLSISKELKEKQAARELEKDDKDKDKFDGAQFQDLLNQEKQILQVYLNRAKTYLIFGQKKKAFQDLQIYIGQKPMDNSIHLIAGRLLFSIGACEDAIKAFSYSPSIDKNRDALLARTKCYIYLKQLNLALKDMEKLIELGDKYVEFDFCCLSALKQASKGDEENFKIALEKIAVGQNLQIRKGNIFTLGDLFFYKGVFYFILGDHQNSKKFMIKSKNIKKLNNELEPYVDQKEMSEEDYEQSFQNRIFTDKEIEYNIGLCELMSGNHQKAKQYLREYEGFVYVFEDVENAEDVIMTPFPTSNRLCSIFPQIEYDNKKRFRLSFDLPGVHPPTIVFETEYKLIEEISMSSIQSRPDAPWIKRNKFGVVFTTSQELLKIQDVDIRTERSQDFGLQMKRNNNDADNSIDLACIEQQNFMETSSNNRVQFIQQQKQKKNQQHLLNHFENNQQDDYNLDQDYQQYYQDHHKNTQQSFLDQKKNLKEIFSLDFSVQQKLNKLIAKKDQ